MYCLCRGEGGGGEEQLLITLALFCLKEEVGINITLPKGEGGPGEWISVFFPLVFRPVC